jgi:hypothetical protein
MDPVVEVSILRNKFAVNHWLAMHFPPDSLAVPLIRRHFAAMHHIDDRQAIRRL